MAAVERFETKLYTNENGWVIWLVTTRTQWDRVKTFFKLQRFENDAPVFSREIIDFPEYIDDLSIFVKHERWTAIRANIYLNTAGDTTSGGTFMGILNRLYLDGRLKDKIDEHNKKTKHKLEFLPTYQYKEVNRAMTVTPYRDEDAVASVTFSEYGGKWSIKYKATVLGINGAAFKVEDSIPVGDIRLRPENISNALLTVFNKVMIQAQLSVSTRKDIVAEVNEFFEKGRFAFWDQINKMSKTV